MQRLFIGFLIALVLCGCGAKGPLYYPAPDAKPGDAKQKGR